MRGVPPKGSLTFSYTSRRLTGIDTSDGRGVDYGFTNGELTSFTDAAGHSTTYGVDAEGKVTSITDAKGVVLVANVYSARDRVESQSTPEGTTTFAYDFLARTTTVTLQGLGEVLTYHHDELGRLVRVTDPDGKFMTQGYGTGGWMTSGVTRIGAETVMSFDGAGNPLTVADPASGTSTLTYDAQNRVETATTPGAGTTTFTYTGTNRIPATITDATGGTTTQTVTNGVVTSTVDPDGVTVLFRYNGCASSSSPRTSTATSLPTNTTPRGVPT